MNKVVFGSHLKEARNLTKLTQEQLAENLISDFIDAYVRALE